MDKMRRVPNAVYPDLFSQHETGGEMSALRPDNPPGVFTLTEDITGVKGRQYARTGDQVRIVADHGNVLIVENITTGERLPLKTEKIKP